MTDSDRIILAIVLVLIDVLLFALPLTGILAAYVIVARPPWFLDWVERLYHGSPGQN